MEFTIATFNLENLGGERPQSPPLAVRLPTLRAQFERLDADILCLQEVNADGQGLPALDAVVAGTPYAAFHRAWTRDSTGLAPRDIHNLVILSRWPIRLESQLRHELVPPPSYRLSGTPTAIQWDRPLLQAEIDIDGRHRLQVINLHLRAPMAAHVADQKLTPDRWRTASGWAEGYFSAAVKRVGQALEARLLVDRLLDDDGEALVAVCGDLNAEPHDMPVRLLCAAAADTGNRELAPRALVPLGDTGGAEAFTVIHGSRRMMLDYILASQALARRCRRVVVDNAALLDDREPAALSALRPGSYHAPVIAEFALP